MKTSVLLICALASLAGCSHFSPEQIKPWQRKELARADMQLVPEPSQEFIDEHIYFSKEAASGGKGVAGGGCGCN
jgi:hypothetical protein